MGKQHLIFLSYRTNDPDGRWGVDTLYAALKKDYDVEVFKDNQEIKYGEPIPGKVTDALEKATIFIPIIGDKWFTTTRPGMRRQALWFDDDWPRHEIKRAIERQIQIVPIYVDIDFPPPEDFPEDIRQLANYQPDAEAGGFKAFPIKSGQRNSDLITFIRGLAEDYDFPDKGAAGKAESIDTWTPSSEWQQKHLERLGEVQGVLRPAILPQQGRQRFKVSEVFVPLELSMEHVPIEPGSIPWVSLIDPVSSALIALIGSAGSGKSTLLRHLALLAAETRLQRLTNDGPVSSIGNDQIDRLPIWIDLPAAAGILRRARGAEDKVPKDLVPEEWLEVVRSSCILQTSDEARTLFETGELLLLCDGLDELVNSSEREEIVKGLAKLPSAYGVPGARNLIVVSCRDQAWERGGAFSHFDRIDIRKMDSTTRDKYLERWCYAVWGEQAKSVLKNLKLAFRTSRSAKEMAANPRTAIMLAVRASKGPLPEQKVALFEQIVDYALDSERLQRYGKVSQIKKYICELALTDQEGGKELSGNRAELILGQLLASKPSELSKSELRETGGALLLDLTLHTGLLTFEGTDAHAPSRIRFTDRTLQEYLVASHFANQNNPAAILEHSTNPAWLESIGLTAGVLAKAEDWEGLESFLNTLLHTPQTNTSPKALFDWGERVAVLSECLVQLTNWKLPERTIAPALKAHQQAGQRLSGFDILTRVSIADGMGLLRDPRLLPQPNHRWVDIPSGQSTMGSDSVEAWRQEQPLRGISLETFKIQRWPTTVEEYARFVEEVGGYLDKDLEMLWDRAGLKWRNEQGIREPKKWDVQRANKNHPVTGISWWEARAYTRWLSSVEELPQGWAISLPTEAQWERVARGPFDSPTHHTGRFPWGGQWDEQREYGNINGQLKEVCAVGLFPDGHSSEGVWDMVGNVSEHCLDGFGPPDPSLVLDPCCLDYRFGHVVRGGNHASPALNARVSARFPQNIEAQLSTVGFRCVAWNVPEALR